jgi:hypothetical protein
LHAASEPLVVEFDAADEHLECRERAANIDAADRGPEMRSTGEVMASGATVSQAYGRVLRASGRGRRGGSISLPLQAAQRAAG